MTDPVLDGTLPAPARSENEIGIGIVRQPRTVLFGPGQRRQIPQLIEPLGRNVLLITDARMAESSEFAELVAALTERGLVAHVYGETEPELPRENVMAVAERFAGEDLAAIVGIGGGSCMDLAKVSAAVLAHGADVRDYYGEFLVPGPGIPVVTVPTTGGTGAEVTCISVVFDTELGIKVGVASPYLGAEIAVIDPELTLTCPPGLTAATGADALSHLVEAFTDRAKNPDADHLASKLYVGKNVFTDVFCREGIALLGRSLPRVVADGSDMAARSDVMRAAYCAGMAINTAGTAGAHAVQTPIGNLTHTPHGFGISALLPSIMRYNLPARETEFAEIGHLLGVAQPGSTVRAQAEAAILRLDAILDEIGAPTNLKALGLGPSDFDTVAEQSLKATRLTDNNPRALTHEAIVAILKHAYDGARDWWAG